MFFSDEKAKAEDIGDGDRDYGVAWEENIYSPVEPLTESPSKFEKE